MAGLRTQMRRVALGLYDAFPRRLVEALAKRIPSAGKRRPSKPVTVEFLRSETYRELMSRHLPHDGGYDQHEAQNQTRSFLFRHREQHHRLGVFRWRGLQENLDQLLDEVTRPGRFVVDFGGAASPLGLGSHVADRVETDVYGDRVSYRSLDELPGQVDVVFSSHALEHVPDLDSTLRVIADVLRPGGTAILHLPAVGCERWRAGNHRSRAYRDHVWTFGLRGTELPQQPPNYVEIDAAVARFLRIAVAEYCGDDSIIIFASKA
jgi:hypothetical protein